MPVDNHRDRAERARSLPSVAHHPLSFLLRFRRCFIAGGKHAGEQQPAVTEDCHLVAPHNEAHVAGRDPAIEVEGPENGWMVVDGEGMRQTALAVDLSRRDHEREVVSRLGNRACPICPIDLHLISFFLYPLKIIQSRNSWDT